jgi:PAS domain S-box-containing protein
MTDVNATPAETIATLQAENDRLQQQLAAMHARQEQNETMLHSFRTDEHTLQKKNAYLTALHRITLGMLRRLDLDDLLTDIITQAAVLAQTSHGYIYLLEADATEMQLRVGLGIHAERTDYRAPYGVGVAGTVWKTGTTLVVDDYRSWSGRPPEFSETMLRSVVGVPLTSGAAVVGVIGLTHVDEEHTFGADEVETLERFAQLASIALDNVRLYTLAQQELAERKQVAERLHMLDRAIAAATNGIVISDVDLPDMPIIYANPAFERITGYHTDEIMGRNCRFLQGKDHDQPGLDELRQALREQRSCDVVLRNYRKDGTLFWNELSIAPIHDEHGRLTHFVGVQNDVTARVNAEDALKKARDDAEAANRAKSAFLANMSHELRTPMNAILGFSQLMSRDPELKPEHRENLEIVVRSGEHLLTLINDVLEMSKIEAGSATLHEESFDLYRMLDDLEELFQLRARDKTLHLIFDRAPALPRHIRTDQIKLRQVLMNLLSNAIKFTEEGGITLRVSTTPTAATEQCPPCRLRFEVEDTGVGIGTDEQEKLFQPFTQTRSGVRAQQGTGLGLSISRQFVRLMGGDMQVTSQPGVGSIFAFNIQVHPAEPTGRESHRATRRIIGIAPGQPAYRILIIEDEWTNRNLLLKLLQPLGFDVREATNGADGISVWEASQPDLILMDMRMPVMDGYEATRRIKAMERGKHTPIVALTASVFSEERTSIMLAGCDDLVRKPFREEELFGAFERHLGVRFLYTGADAADADAADGQEPHDTEPTLTAEALAALPAGWVVTLHQAATEADAEKLLELSEQIRTEHPAVAAALSDMVDNFLFDEIMEMTERG